MRLPSHECPSIADLGHIQPMATFVVRSPDEIAFVSKQVALEEVAVPIRKYLNHLPGDLRDELLNSNDLDRPQLTQRLDEFQRLDSVAVQPDREWMASADQEGLNKSQVERDRDFASLDSWNMG